MSNVSLKWGWALLFFVISVLSFGLGQAERIIVVSKPPPPIVASDPPQGLLFEAPHSMASSSVLFDTQGGPESLEYLVFDDNNAFITFDDGPNAEYPGGILVVTDFLARGGSFDASQDRLITGAQAGLLEPKGIALAPEQNVIIVADFAAAQIVAFAADATGDTAPLFVVEDLGVDAQDNPRRPWGLIYDAANNRLFVGATDGNVLVFDNFLENEVRPPSRIITPTLNDYRVSSNLHDLSYLSDQDTLILSDVGSATTGEQANFDTDGSIMAVENASEAKGDTEVSVYLAGANTLLGNPVGLDFDGGSLFVTERTQDLVLRFDDFLTIETADTAPNAIVTVAKPEDVVIAPP